MNSPPPERADGLMLALRFELAAVGVLGVGLLAVAVAGRLGSPVPLEWMEAGTLHHALRLLQGKSLYAAPAAEFVPYLYPPLGYLPMAASIATLGPTLMAARLPSVLALVATLLCLGAAAARLGGDRRAGWLAAGFWALGFGYCGAFMDLARIDALFIALIAGALWALESSRFRLAFLLLALSPYVKQHGVLFLGAASVWLLWQHRRRAWIVAAAGAFVLAAYASLQLRTEGWFATYTLTLPASHAPEPKFFATFFVGDLGVLLAVLTVASVVALIRHREAPRASDAMLVAGILAGALGRAHPGGFDNVRMPALAVLVVVGSATLARGMLNGHGDRKKRVWIGFAVILQAILLAQSPTLYWPSAEARTHFMQLDAALRQCGEGVDTVVLDHPLRGSRPYLHSMAVSDLRMGEVNLARQATEALLAGLASSDGPQVVAVGERFPELDALLASHFEQCTTLHSPKLASGHTPANQVIYRRTPNP